MGSVCCCLHNECEDYVNPNSSIYRNCICLQCFLQNFVYMYTLIFQRGEEHVRLPSLSSIQGANTSFTSSASLDNSLSGVYRSPPRPLPYDVDPRYIRLQRDGLVSGHEKGSSGPQEESDPLRRSDSDNGNDNDNDDDTDPLCGGNKWNNSSCGDGTKGLQNKSCSLKSLTSKKSTGFEHIFTSSEDEDVCPTCLEEYSTENPKIITKCSHHFHLGCIYEWMERSESCPVCGKVMGFDETV